MSLYIGVSGPGYFCLCWRFLSQELFVLIVAA